MAAEFLPYKVFEYSNHGIECRLRPEEARGWHSFWDEDIKRMVVLVLMRDSTMRLWFKTRDEAQHFVSALTDFVNSDAVRNTRNAIARNAAKVAV